MNHSLLLLIVAYALLAFLLLFLCVWTRWHVAVKIGLVALVTVAYFVAYEGWQESQGWPAQVQLPQRFVLLAVVTEEPSSELGHKGNIYLWVNALKNNKPAAQPRAYRLPYDKDLHSLFNDAMKKNRQGNSQMGTLEPPSGPRGKGFSWLMPGPGDKPKIKISDLPRPQLPEK